MSRSLLVATLLSCCLAPQAIAQVQFQDLSLSAALERARMDDKLVMVFFASKNCNKSAFLANEFFPNPVYADSIEAAFVSIQIDADVPETRRYYDQYDLWGVGADPSGEKLPVPRVLFLDALGEQVGLAQGVPARPTDQAEQADFSFDGTPYRFSPEGMLRKIMIQVEKASPR